MTSELVKLLIEANRPIHIAAEYQTTVMLGDYSTQLEARVKQFKLTEITSETPQL